MRDVAIGAQIYRFPTERRSVSRRPHDAKAASQPAPLPRTEFGSGWYHETAILEEAKRRGS